MSSAIQLLQDTAARLLADADEPDRMQGLAADRFPEPLWRSLEENGIFDVTLPEESGGVELEIGEALRLLRVAGAFALSIPWAETLVARHLAARTGLALPRGPVQLWIGPGPSALHSEIDQRGARLIGRATLPWAATLPIVAMAPGRGSEHGVIAVLTDLPTLGSGTTLDGAPCATLELDSCIPPGDSWRPAPAPMAEDALCLGAVARSQMIAGAMERILDLTLEYARSRVQFGRPIGRFQAVQQLIARLAAEVAAVGVAADAACAALTEGSTGSARLLAVASAKSQASASASTVAGIAHQVHGAIGYTREHELQLFTRCLWSWRDRDGDETFWQHRAGQLALDAGASGLWNLLVTR